MDDAADLRTRLIFASLEDDELVRQLREGQVTAAPAGRPPHGTVIDVRDPMDVQARPWPASARPAAPGHRSSEWSVDDPSYYLG